MAAIDTSASRITRGTSDVRLAGAICKMRSAQTQQALAAIKDAAKSLLLERDLPALKEAYEKRKQYLRSISTTPIQNEGPL